MTDLILEKLKFFDENTLFEFKEKYHKYYYDGKDLEKYKEWANKTKRLDDAVREMLSVEEFADLETLYYLGRDRVYGEYYEHLLNKAVLAFGRNVASVNIHHLMSKTNLLEAVADGVEKAGRTSLAERLRVLRDKDV